MKKTSILVAFVAAVMMMFTSSTAQAATTDTTYKAGMLPFVMNDFPPLTKKQYLDYLLDAKIETDWKFYVAGFKAHAAEYAAAAKQQVKARVQILNKSTDKLSDQELADFINDKCEIVPVKPGEVVNSTALVINSKTGKVLGHAVAKTRTGPRINETTKAIENKLVVKATGDVVSYLSCVNTGTDDPTEVTTDTDDGSDEGGDDESTEETTIKKTVTASNGKIDLNINIKNINRNINTNTNTNKNENTAVVEKTKKSSAWDDDNVDYSNHYSTEKTKKVDYDDERYEWVKKVKSCNDCDDGQNKKLLAEILRQQRKTKRIAIADLTFDILNLGVASTHFGMWLSGLLKGRRGTESIDNVFGSDGGFVFANNSTQQTDVFGADGQFENAP